MITEKHIWLRNRWLEEQSCAPTIANQKDCVVHCHRDP